MRTIRRKIAMTAAGPLGAAGLLTTNAVNAHADYTDGKQADRVN